MNGWMEIVEVAGAKDSGSKTGSDGSSDSTGSFIAEGAGVGTFGAGALEHPARSIVKPSHKSFFFIRFSFFIIISRTWEKGNRLLKTDQSGRKLIFFKEKSDGVV